MFNLNAVRDYQKYQVIDWRSGVFILLLVSGLSWFYVHTQMLDTDKNKNIVNALFELRQFSTKINEQVLLAQQHDFHNYDGLTQGNVALMPLLEIVKVNLTKSRLEGSLVRLEALVNDLEALQITQTNDLELFKSKNALLKNSLHFLPKIADSVLSGLRESGVGGSKLINDINRLNREVLSYNLTGDLYLLPKVQSTFSQFRKRYSRFVLPINRDLRRMLAHIQIILTTRQIVNELSDELLSLPLIDVSITLEKMYVKSYESSFEGVENARLVMYLFSLVLLFYIGFLFRCMHQQSSQLKQSAVEQKHTEEALFLEKEMAQFTLQSIGGGVIRTNLLGEIDFMNLVAERLTGVTIDKSQGEPLEQIFAVMDELTGEYKTDLVHQSLQVNDTLSFVDNCSVFSQDGYSYPIRLIVEPIRDSEGEQLGVVLVFHDVGEERRLRQRLMYQANHDGLTGLINRREFEKRLDVAILDAQRHSKTHALLFLDLDQFKIVNDTCGHIAGDALLKMLSQKLQIQLGEQDTLSRLGGDEFCVLLLNSSVENSLAISSLLQKLVAGFVFEWDGKIHQVGVSIGVNMIDKMSVGLYEVMSGADVACYAAKEQGRNRVRLYQSDDEETSRYQNEMEWLTKIRESIKNERLVLYCQAIEPAVRESNHKPHFEILLRMKNEQGDLIAPDAFMRSAERFGVMPDIDRWVVEHVFKEFECFFADFSASELPELAINLSGASFNDPTFCAFLVSMFDTYDVPATSICFEITETSAIVSLVQAEDFINQFAAMGCKFSLDDFGTGLSSFGYLKNLSVDYLKIDGGFVRDLISDSIDQATVGAINQVGHSLGLKTIAEWVENVEIQDRLIEMGVDYLQGYHLHRPEPMLEVFQNRFGHG